MKVRELFESRPRFDPNIFGDDLFYYLSGEDNVDPDWVARVLKRRAKGPDTLYRLELVKIAHNIELGEMIQLDDDKLILSASDKIENAVYGGCSYHHSYGTKLNGKMLVVVEIKNPEILINYKELYDFAYYDCEPGYAQIVEDEREYLIKSRGVVGKVLHFTQDTKYVTRGDYKKLVKQRESWSAWD